MIKVLQWGMSSEKNKGGVETYLINQVRSLPGKGIIYDFVNCSDDIIAYKNEIQIQGRIYNIGSRHRNPLLFYYRMFRLFFSIRKYKYDVFILNAADYSKGVPFLGAWIAGIKCRIMHAHGSGYENKVKKIKLCIYMLNRWIVKFFATDYWACSKHAGRFLFGEHNVFIVRNGINVRKFSFNKRKRDMIRSDYNLHGKFVIGHVGRFSPVKNHLFIIELLKELNLKKDNFILMLLGDNSDYEANDGYVRKIYNEIEKYNLEDHVMFMGAVDNVSDFYQAMDLLVLPSFHEGFPLVALEAQAAGLPCVVSLGVTDEIVITKNVYRIDNGKSELWIKKIIDILHMNIDRDAANDSVFKAGYDVNTEIDRILLYIRKLLGDIG